MADEPTLSRRSLFRGLGTATILAGCKTPDESQSPDATRGRPQDGRTESAPMPRR